MKKLSLVLVTIVVGLSIYVMGATPTWIQHSERVVGENSPYYTDVVNRPAKEIWANFTSQHDASGGHKTFIFPTPIPTAAFPTPFPTATPITIPTPLPTATPITIPTPLPTATPIASTVLEHPDDKANHIRSYLTYTISSFPATLDATEDYCQGAIIVLVDDGIVTLPSRADIEANTCHTLRFAISHNNGETSIHSGTNTLMLTLAHADTVFYVTTATPLGFFLELFYNPDADQWIVGSERGAWSGVSQ